MNGCEDVGPWAGRPRAEMMKSDEVEAMLHLHALGWGLKRIAREFGCSKNTVRRYVAADGWMAYSRPVRGGKLEAQEAWLKECFFRHRGNAEVVRQDLLRELSIDVSLRTVERAVAPFRRLLTAEAKATVRFETAPGHQLQIDFGELRVPIADERVRVYLFVATLGYSRRCHVEAFRHERQSSWFRGLEGTFRHFGGVTKEVLTLMHPLILQKHQITPKTSRYTRCSMSMLPNVSINGRIRSSGQLGRWWYSISPCRNNECVRRFTVFAFNQRS